MLNRGKEDADWSFFRTLEPGVYNFVICDGVDTFTNENSGKTSFKIPLKVLDGDSQGITMTKWVPMSKKGDDMLADLVVITGLYSYISEAFPSEETYLSDTVLGALKKKLPGKAFVGRVENSKGLDGKDRPELVGIKRMGGSSAAPPKASRPTSERPDDEWAS